jgi:hypothetical protein
MIEKVVRNLACTLAVVGARQADRVDAMRLTDEANQRNAPAGRPESTALRAVVGASTMASATFV